MSTYCVALICFFTVFLLPSATHAFKTVTIGGKLRVSRDLGPQIVESKDFVDWFARKETLNTVLDLNPGIENFELLETRADSDTSVYKAHLSPIQFPGVSIKNSLNIETCFDGSSFQINCKEGGMEQTVEGNKYFAKLVSKLIPSVASSSTLGYDPDSKQLFNDAEIAITFGVPKWFPVPAGTIEQSSSKVIQSNIEKDTNVLLESLIQRYMTTLDRVEEAKSEENSMNIANSMP